MLSNDVPDRQETGVGEGACARTNTGKAERALACLVPA